MTAAAVDEIVGLKNFTRTRERTKAHSSYKTLSKAQADLLRKNKEHLVFTIMNLETKLALELQGSSHLHGLFRRWSSYCLLW